MTLLSKAKELKRDRNPPREITDQHIELAVALIQDKIGMAQACQVLKIKKHSGSVYSWMLRALKQGFLEKKITLDIISKKKPKKRDALKVEEKPKRKIKKKKLDKVLRPSKPKEMAFCQFSKCSKKGELIQKSKMVGIYNKGIKGKMWFCSNKCLKGFDIESKLPIGL